VPGLAGRDRTAGSWHAISDTLYTVVEQRIAAAEATDGLFHPATLPALEAAGYDRDYDEIALDPIRRRIRLPARARLDLGDVVKGWAADVALERFFADFENVFINASGDMRAWTR
jgi:thiamine biosynthesis lipoprotein ApbE